MTALLLLLHPSVSCLPSPFPLNPFLLCSSSPNLVAPRWNGLHRPAPPQIRPGPASPTSCELGWICSTAPWRLHPHARYPYSSQLLPLVGDLTPPTNTSNAIGAVHVVPNPLYPEFQHEFHHRHVLRGPGETRYDPTSFLTIGRDPYFSKLGYLALCLQLSQHSREDGPRRSIHR